MIVFSVVLGLVAVVLAAQWITQQTTVGASKVVVAAIDVDLGQKLIPEMMMLADWPSGSVPTGSSSDIKTLDTRVLKTSIQRGEPILESKLAPLGTKGGLSAVVEEGKRAMTVRVNDVIGVAGFALPGNFVDILVNTNDDTRASSNANNKDRTISKIVLERILVLAVAQEASRDETKPKVVNAVTLEVTPDQAERLDLARSVGTLSLVLRNQIDPKAADTEGATKLSLLRQKPEPLPAPASVAVLAPAPKPVIRRAALAPAPARECVEVVRGATRYTECF